MRLSWLLWNILIINLYHLYQCAQWTEWLLKIQKKNYRTKPNRSDLLSISWISYEISIHFNCFDRLVAYIFWISFWNKIICHCFQEIPLYDSQCLLASFFFPSKIKNTWYSHQVCICRRHFRWETHSTTTWLTFGFHAGCSCIRKKRRQQQQTVQHRLFGHWTSWNNGDFVYLRLFICVSMHAKYNCGEIRFAFTCDIVLILNMRPA